MIGERFELDLLLGSAPQMAEEQLGQISIAIRQCEQLTLPGGDSGFVAHPV